MRFNFLFSLLFFVLSNYSTAQKINKVVNKEIYTSYYSTDLRVPLYVVHYLYNGGGDFSLSKVVYELPEKMGFARPC